MATQDWFADNAPSAGGGDWFAANAPTQRKVESPIAAPGVKSPIPPKGTLPPEIPTYAWTGDVRRGSDIGPTLGSMAKGLGQVSTPGIVGSLVERFRPGTVPKQAGVLPLSQVPAAATQALALGGGLEGMLEGPPKPPVARVPEVPPEFTSTLTPEQQAEFTRKLDVANQPYLKELRQQDLATRQNGIASKLYDNVQQTHEAVRGGLNQRWEEMRNAVGETPVATKPILDSIDKARAQLAGVPEDLRVFNQIVNYMDQQAGQQMGAEAERALAQGDQAGLERWISERAAGEGAPQAPEGIPWNDARRQFTALGEQWAKTSGNVRRALSTVKDAYDTALGDTAKAAGQGDAYTSLKNDWHQYMEDWQGKGPLAKVLSAQHPNLIVPTVLGRGNALLAEQMGRYGTAGADPRIAQEMLDVTQAGKRAPLPAVAPPPPPEGTVNPITRHAMRIAGKIIGGKIGSMVGHPMIGYGAGGELGSELANQMGRTTPPPPPISQSPSAYARDIMEQAKSGKITQAQADAAIRRAGGSTATRRMAPANVAPTQPPPPPR